MNPSGMLEYWVLRGLSVIGAAALGGFLAGFIVQLAARSTTTRKAPPSVVRLMRVLGAITCGIVVAYLLFHGWGPGGGGSGSGGGKDSGVGPYSENRGKDAATRQEQPKSTEAAHDGTSLRIEVVVGSVAEGRHYRVDGEDKSRTLKEVESVLIDRLRKEPPMKEIAIVLYQDSPAEDTPIVRNLVDLAYLHHLTPNISKPNEKRR
jgi:hypothetical protein